MSLPSYGNHWNGRLRSLIPSNIDNCNALISLSFPPCFVGAPDLTKLRETGALRREESTLGPKNLHASQPLGGKLDPLLFFEIMAVARAAKYFHVITYAEKAMISAPILEKEDMGRNRSKLLRDAAHLFYKAIISRGNLHLQSGKDPTDAKKREESTREEAHGEESTRDESIREEANCEEAIREEDIRGVGTLGAEGEDREKAITDAKTRFLRIWKQR